ncbi:flippase [Thalassotalea sp. PS06]|uniref:flippase n=1 Tax=Thalassotalea sp. PS06 TaxID=2594005 RepID=UPI0011640C1E|nr:flippase [Thalassotalea sp. PS06]QDP01991.1 flippase [Thalassotalea sp. PS06]
MDTLKTKIQHNLKITLSDKNFSELLSGSFLTFGSKILALAFSFAVNIIIARYYGAEIIGIIAIIVSFLAFATMLSSVGLSTSILRLIPEQLATRTLHDVKKIIFKSFAIVIFASSAVSILLWFNIELIANYIPNGEALTEWFHIAIFFILLSSLFNLNQSIIRALKEVKLFAAIQTVQPLINLVLLVLVTSFFWNVNNPVYIFFCSIAFGFILTSILIVTSLAKKTDYGEKNIGNSPYTVIQIISISWPMFMTNGMSVVVLNTDTLMLGALAGTKDAGIYAVVMKLGMLLTFVLTSINMVVAPKFSELYFSSRLEDLKALAQKSSQLIFYTTLPIIITFFLFGKYLLGVFGEEFVTGYYALLIIAVSQLINSTCGSVGYFLNMTGNQKIFNSIVCCGALINVFLNYLLIPPYGIEGAAVASLVSTIFWNVISTVVIYKRFNIFIGYRPRRLI